MRREPRTCVVCGMTFAAAGRARYCSRACAHRVDYQRHAEQRRATERQRYARVAHSPRACATCGQPFTPVRSDHRYCSPTCQQWAWRRQVGIIVGRGPRTCAVCGVTFVGTPQACYCSTACKNRRPHLPRTGVVHTPQACAQCGQLFTPLRTTARYCSPACSHRGYYQRHAE